MFLTITGKLGSGKSTICKIFADKYGFEIYSTGKIQRKIANDMGISTLQLNELMREDSRYDDLIDNEVVRISKERKGDNIIFDSRMAFHFVEDSYDIFTTIDPQEAAKRVMLSPRGNEEIYQNEETAKKKLLERGKVENLRFKDIYHVDNQDYGNYSLILDTSWSGPEELADLIHKMVSDGWNRQALHMLLSPKSVYPTAKITNADMEKAEQYRKKMFADDEMITLVYFENYHYIVNGCYKLIAALLDKKPFIQAKIVKVGECGLSDSSDQFIKRIGQVGKSTLHDYENIGGFKYISYPEYY